MAKTDTEIKFSIENAIKGFSSGNLTENSLNLFQVLGYNTERQQRLPDKTFACFKEYYLDSESRFNEEKALTKEWQQIDLLFQLTKEEVTGQNSLFDTSKVDRNIIQAYLFFCIELNDKEYTRTALSQITREINKVFKMPVMVLFKLGDKLSLAVINRRRHKKDLEKDVLEKVTLIKDINIPKPHRAHLQILFDLSLEELRRVHKFTNFVELHEAWKKTLDTKELNKRFYKELSNWYFWAIKEVYFPGAPFQATLGANAATDPQVREHNAKNLIRLLTRLLFVWFVKEKNLVPDQLFDKRFIKDSLLNGFDPAKTSTFDDHAKASRYYRAVLQNLFFASLNQVVGKREFRKQGQHMNVTNLMRYESYFKDPQAFVALIDNVVPFMNGGLFECLDKPDPQKKGKQGGDVIIYEDGFSDRADNTLCVPDYIFFSNSEHADLSSELDDKKQSNVTVRGLINILKDYKFTVTENTPIEEDIALDPELLGRVFENLLASYNPETKTTARKQTGSFYTPREIVDYMVDESLKAYLKQKLVAVAGLKEEDADVGLNILFSYTEKVHAFNYGEKQVLIEAIDTCKVLDPACGSGAFPMGILHKLVYILHKLDPDNVLWREQQRQNAIKETEDAFRIGNQEERENRLKDISNVFENNAGDYGRKLYLIENCIYGVDIQPIATQISKLRFFISLVVDQQSNTDRAHNYGVIPLPNLETKFVAANSLIGLKKPEHQINCFDNQSVKNIAEQIQEIRHKLFSAKTPETKRKLREKDDALRKQLRDLLISNGLGTDTAHQLAAWDPYDQNAKSPFFDMEWMFGIDDGFDVVIGNPPYKQVPKGIFPLEQYSFSEGKDKGKQNLYKVFVEASKNFSKKGSGTACMIVQSSLLCDLSSTFTRELLIKCCIINEIIEFPKTAPTPEGQVFENVLQGTCIYRLINRKPNRDQIFRISTNNDVTTLNDLKFEEIIQNSLLNLYPETYYIPLVKPGDFNPINKVRNHSTTLDGYIKSINQGDINLTAAKNYFTIEDTGIKLYRGKNVQRFNLIKDVDEYVLSEFKPEKAKSNAGLRFLVCQEITGTTDKYRLHFCATTLGDIYLFGHTANKILLKDNIFLEAIAVILNSKFMDWLFRKTSTNNHVMGYEIIQFPIPNIIIDFVGILKDFYYIMNHFMNKSLRVSPLFESFMNAIVFNLFFLDHMKEREIDVLDFVESDIRKVLQANEFEKLKDDEKEIAIAQLLTIWNDPNNEVRNRIKLFAVRSPEILKPIIES